MTDDDGNDIAVVYLSSSFQKRRARPAGCTAPAPPQVALAALPIHLLPPMPSFHAFPLLPREPSGGPLHRLPVSLWGEAEPWVHDRCCEEKECGREDELILR